MINQNISNMMKACAILMVIFEHILVWYFHINSSLNMILGTGGVAIFLILSGYGLTVSYLTKGISDEYWEHKIRKVFIPYWVVTGLYAIITGLVTPSNSETLLENILLIDYDRRIDGTMWYLSFLLIWYVLFGGIFKYKYSLWIKILLLFAFAWLFFDNPSGWFGECSWQFSRNAFSFPAGVLLGGFISAAR